MADSYEIESRLEISLSRDGVRWMDYSDEFWIKFLAPAGIRILSSADIPAQRSYVLSESSLFMDEYNLLAITCGQGKLAGSIEYLLENISHENITEFFLQIRSAPHVRLDSEKVRRSFADLHPLMNRIGFAVSEGLDENLSTFRAAPESGFFEQAEDTNLQLTASQLGIFGEKATTLDKRSQILDVSKRWKAKLRGFVIIDHVFEPLGYSLNAIGQGCNIALHVNLSAQSTTASLDTNMPEGQELDDVIKLFLETMRPEFLNVFSSGVHPTGLTLSPKVSFREYQVKQVGQ